MKNILNHIQQALRSGEGISAALEAYPDTFPAYFRNALFVGENTGRLEEVLGMLVIHLRREEAVRRKTIEASLYPLIILSSAWITIFWLSRFVLPRILKIYQGFGTELPWLSQMLINCIHAFLPVSLAVLLFLGVVWLRFRGRLSPLKQFLRRIPGMRALLRDFRTLRFAGLFALLVRSGVPILQALRTMQNQSGENDWRDGLGLMVRKIEKGESLGAALHSQNWMSAQDLLLIETGEESGHLPEVMEKLAGETQTRLEFNLFMLLKLAEPLLILLVGIFIGGVVIAVLLPMLQMNNLIR